jgi:hypothetical protein
MGKSETAVQNIARRDAAFFGPVWRNNSGVLLDANGTPVRFGLANESKKENERVKSSDLIGITEVMITGDMIGQTIGVFTAYECKPEGWTLRPSDKRAHAQAAFHAIVRKSGGYAGFVTKPEDVLRIIGR